MKECSVQHTIKTNEYLEQRKVWNSSPPLDEEDFLLAVHTVQHYLVTVGFRERTREAERELAQARSAKRWWGGGRLIGDVVEITLNSLTLDFPDRWERQYFIDRLSKY